MTPAVKLRKTPRRWHGRDSEFFPHAHASWRARGTPKYYYVELSGPRVHLTIDPICMHPDLHLRLARLQSLYMGWWVKHGPHFPRRGLTWSSYEYVSMSVLREHADWWITLFDTLPFFSYDPYAVNDMLYALEATHR